MTSKGQLPCYLCEKPLRDPVRVTNPDHLEFIRKRFKEMREEYEICRRCLQIAVQTYERKYNKKRRMLKEQRAMTISSTTNESHSQPHQDEYDALVQRTPLNKSLRPIMKLTMDSGNRSSDKENESTTSNSIEGLSEHLQWSDLDTTNNGQSSIGRKRVPAAASAPVPAANITSSESSVDAPTTSAAAAAKAQRGKQQPSRVTFASPMNQATPTISTAVKRPADELLVPPTGKAPGRGGRKWRRIVQHPTGDDSDDIEPSPNALNGSRLPHIQPVVRSRPFQHPDPRVMDIYLAGTTGG